MITVLTTSMKSCWVIVIRLCTKLGGEGTIIQAKLEDLLRDKREAVGILEGSEDEDDTRN